MATTGPLNPSTLVNDTSSGAVNWSNPTNANSSNNTYATYTSFSSQSYYLKATNFGFSIPVGSTIDGIVVEIERKASRSDGLNNCRDIDVKLVKSSGTFGTINKAATGTNWPTSDTIASYGSSSDLWGETWSASDINSSNFGVGLRAFTTIDLSCTASVDSFAITVYYTAGAGPSSQTAILIGAAF